MGSATPFQPTVRFLSEARERELVARWRDSEDAAALAELVAAHRPLVLKIASRFRPFGLPLADLVQEGQVGLLEAAHRFDPARAVRFATYAQWWIKSAIQEFALRNVGSVRLVTSSRHKSLLTEIRRRSAAGTAAGTDADKAALARRHGVSVEAVDGMMLRLGARDVSLDARIGPDAGLTVADTIPCDRPTPEQTALEGDERRFRSAALGRALAALPERERRIIADRHLADDERPILSALGAGMGVSKERVRQLEKRALARLRRLMIEERSRAEA
jgi:RNA polymerase sigma-32 factor